MNFSAPPTLRVCSHMLFPCQPQPVGPEQTKLGQLAFLSLKFGMQLRFRNFQNSLSLLELEIIYSWYGYMFICTLLCIQGGHRLLSWALLYHAVPLNSWGSFLSSEIVEIQSTSLFSWHLLFQFYLLSPVSFSIS